MNKKTKPLPKARSINPNLSRHTASNASAQGLSFLNASQDGYTKIHKRDPTFVPPAPQTQHEQQKMNQWSEKRYGPQRGNTQESIASTQSAPAFTINNNRKQNAFATPNINPSMQPQMNRPMTQYPMQRGPNPQQRHNQSMPYHMNNMNRNMPMHNNTMSPQQRPMNGPRHNQSMPAPNMNRYSTVPPNMILQNGSSTNLSYSAHRGPASPIPQQMPMNHMTLPNDNQDQYVELGQPVISDAWATSRQSTDKAAVVRSSVSKSKSAYKEPLLEDDIDYEDVGDRKSTMVKAKGCCVIL